jgi:hypothetical protein
MDATDGGIQGGKHHIMGKSLALVRRLNSVDLPLVGIADQRDQGHRTLLATAPLLRAPRHHLSQIRLNFANTVGESGGGQSPTAIPRRQKAYPTASPLSGASSCVPSGCVDRFVAPTPPATAPHGGGAIGKNLKD